MLTAGFRCAPDTLPMNKMMAMTISPGATTAAWRLIMPGKAWLIMPAPAATRTKKNVPSSSEDRRRHLTWIVEVVDALDDALLVAGQHAFGREFLLGLIVTSWWASCR